MASSIDTTKPTAVRAFTADVRQNFSHAKSEIEALQGRADALETVTTGLDTAAYQPTTAFATAAQGLLADSATQPGDNVSTLTNDAGYVDAAGALAAAPAETATTIGALIAASASKTTPVDADSVAISDSEAAGVLKRVTWSNIKATLKTYFDTIYATAAQLALKANITSPGLLGTPTCPTPDPLDSSTQIANTAFVQAELSTHTQPMSRVTVDSSAQIGSPTHIDTLTEIYNHVESAGLTNGGDITDNGDGTVDLTEGEALIRATDDPHTTLYSVVVPAATSLALTDESTNYISVSYNAGSPQYTVSTSVTSFNCMDVCICYVVYRSGTSLNIIDAREQNVDLGRKTRRLFLDFSRFIHASGGTALGSPSGLYISVTSGSFYFMVQNIPHDAFDTSVAGTANVNVFKLWYRDGVVGWTGTANQKTVTTTTYDNNAGTPSTLDNNKYGVTWFYMVHNSPSSLHAVMGQAQYATLADAVVASPPATVPELIGGSGSLIGFVAYQKSAVSYDSILSAFSTVFTPSAATKHNGLSGLQGGTTNEYYHLTSAEQVDAAALSALDGQSSTVTPADTALIPLWVAGVYEKFSISAFKSWLASLTATWTNKTLTAPIITSTTWAAAQAAIPDAGSVIKVSDVGIDGGALFLSDGTNIYPASGTQVRLELCTMGIFLAPDGTVGANGAFTLGTSLPVTLGGATPGIWLYFPAGALYSGSSAGFFWCVLSTPTTGTAYDNTYVPGSTSFAPPSSPTAIVDAGPGAFSGTTSEVTTHSILMPGKLMGRFGSIIEYRRILTTSSANTKTTRLRLNGTATHETDFTAIVKAAAPFSITNIGSESAQSYNPDREWATVNNVSSWEKFTAVDTSADVTITLTLQRANSTEALGSFYTFIDVEPHYA